jgi:hypothetical protein
MFREKPLLWAGLMIVASYFARNYLNRGFSDFAYHFCLSIFSFCLYLWFTRRLVQVGIEEAADPEAHGSSSARVPSRNETQIRVPASVAGYLEGKNDQLPRSEKSAFRTWWSALGSDRKIIVWTLLVFGVAAVLSEVFLEAGYLVSFLGVLAGGLVFLAVVPLAGQAREGPSKPARGQLDPRKQ